MTQLNIAFLIVGAILAGAVAILGVIGLLVKRACISLKPLYWFAGFMSLILLPQLAGHLLNAYMDVSAYPPTSSPSKSPSMRWPENASLDFDYADPGKLFGARSAGLLVVDGRATASGLLRSAQNPKFYVLSGGETLLIGRFASPPQAHNAVATFLRQARLADRARTDDAGGFGVERGPADFVYVRAFGDLFTAWSGPTPGAIAQLRIAAGFHAPQGEVPGRAEALRTEWLDAAIKRAAASWSGLALVVAALLAYVLLVALYFFKGLAWSTRADPPSSANALPTSALRERLLAINFLDIPFHLETGKNTAELIAIWRYADAKWLDHARAHGMRRLHRIVLQFDARNRKVRAADFVTAFDWSAGGAGAALNWKFVTGVVLFQYDRQKVFGLQFTEHGQLKPSLAYSYTFNLQEMKGPLIAAVTGAGWTWQPVAWNAPAWLKWLTE